MKFIKSLPLRWAIYLTIPIILISFLLPAGALYPLLIPAVGLNEIGFDLSFGPTIGIGDVMGLYYLPQIIPSWIIIFVIGYFIGKRVEKQKFNKV